MIEVLSPSRDTVVDTETLDLGTATLKFVHTPGHTPGSLSVYYSDRDGGKGRWT